MLGALFALQAQARDFTYTYQGQTLTYTVVDEDAKICCIAEGKTGANIDDFIPAQNVSGDVVIPKYANDGTADYLVNYISKASFANCRSIESVTISYGHVSAYAFFNCTALKTVKFLDGNRITDTSIGYSAFDLCESLSDLTLSNTLSSIGDRAFNNCGSLTSLNLKNVVNIGKYAFNYCESLKSITLPNTVKTVGKSAFNNCIALNSFMIGSGVESMDFSTFGYLNELIEINVDAQNPVFSSIDGVLYNKDKSTLLRYPAKKSGEVNIPSTVKTIGKLAFGQCSLQSSIIIPNSVTTIEDFAFQGAVSLTSISIPNSVNSIGGYVFDYCKGLVSITIPNSVKTMGSAVFYRCYALSTAVLPETLTKIPDNLFCECSGLKTVNVPDNVAVIEHHAFYNCLRLETIIFPSSLTTIDRMAFYKCPLKTITLPAGVESISSNSFDTCTALTAINVDADNQYYSSINGVLYDKNLTKLILHPAAKTGQLDIPVTVIEIQENSCSDCIGLTSVTIPGSVTTLGNYSFYNCSGLKSITLPPTVSTIGNYAFANCVFTDVYALLDTPPAIGKNSFRDTYIATLHVPESSVDSYRSAEYWSYFANIVGDASGIEDVVADNDVNAAPVEVYNLSGVKVSNSTETLAPGIYIVRQGTVTKKIAVQ